MSLNEDVPLAQQIKNQKTAGWTSKFVSGLSRPGERAEQVAYNAEHVASGDLDKELEKVAGVGAAENGQPKGTTDEAFASIFGNMRARGVNPYGSKTSSKKKKELSDDEYDPEHDDISDGPSLSQDSDTEDSAGSSPEEG